jgi:chemotaxis protein histidine kinase CheA
MAAFVHNAAENLHPDDLDDYVAECDEHLAAARRGLFELETLGDLSSAGREPLDALFRAFHTIKGLSAMVGAQAAEDAAHRLEAYLGAVRGGDAPLTESGVDALLEGVRLIESAVVAFRSSEPPPDTDILATRLGALIASASSLSGSHSAPQATLGRRLHFGLRCRMRSGVRGRRGYEGSKPGCQNVGIWRRLR